MKDKLVIHDVVAECRIGAFEWEQAHPQNIWMDLELAIDAKQAAAQDDVRSTIDYGRLVTAVKQHVQHKPFKLLETMAEEVAALILKEFKTSQVTVRVKKRALPGVDYAAVEIARPA
jgi:dihydroneopterin aldolase